MTLTSPSPKIHFGGLLLTTATCFIGPQPHVGVRLTTSDSCFSLEPEDVFLNGQRIGASPAVGELTRALDTATKDEVKTPAFKEKIKATLTQLTDRDSSDLDTRTAKPDQMLLLRQSRLAFQAFAQNIYLVIPDMKLQASEETDRIDSLYIR